MTDERRRAKELRFAANPTDPALLDEAVAERRRSGLPIGELLARRRFTPAEFSEPRLKFKVLSQQHDEQRLEIGSTPGTVAVSDCALWWVEPDPKKLTPAVAAVVQGQSVPGLNLDGASGLKGSELDLLAGCEHLTYLSLGVCWRLENSALRALAALPRLDTVDVGNCKLNADGLAHLCSLPRLVRLSLRSSRTLNDAALTVLARSSIERVSLGDSKFVTDDTLASLPVSLTHLNLNTCKKVTGAGVARLTGLRELCLRGCERLSEAGIAAISRLSGLTHLNLSRCTRKKTFDRGGALDPLRELVHLEDLRLEATPESPGGHGVLRHLRSLRHLDLSNGTGTDATLAALAGHPSLEHLELDYSDVTDAGLQHLRELPRLRRLSVSHCRAVTDSAVTTLLRDTPSLRELALDFTGVTRETVEALAREGRLDRYAFRGPFTHPGHTSSLPKPSPIAAVTGSWTVEDWDSMERYRKQRALSAGASDDSGWFVGLAPSAPT